MSFVFNHVVEKYVNEKFKKIIDLFELKKLYMDAFQDAIRIRIKNPEFIIQTSIKMAQKKLSHKKKIGTNLNIFYTIKT